MQSDPFEPPLDSVNESGHITPTSSHHGLSRSSDSAAAPSPSRLERYGGMQESGSEWSLSDSATPSDYNAWIGPGNALGGERSLSIDSHISDIDLQESEQHSRKHVNRDLSNSRGSALLGCPHEILLHVLSHLPATDLLTVKLVSRQLYRLVNSPHAWISAFCKYFPGPTALKASRARGSSIQDGLMTEKRSFTRIAAVPSWTGEYLLRTKLLRCIVRGRPSVPMLATSQGKPHKGYSIFTYSTRVGVITDLNAKFGTATGDKRLPQYMHGSSLTGAVSMSDRRGELASWGIRQGATTTRHFADLFPGSAPYGLGAGDLVGLPNVMDVSVNHGLIYAEGFPGGISFFLPANDKRAKYLAPVLGVPHPEEMIPKISPELDTPCSVWIAKIPAVPRLSRGLFGMLVGSSSGVISAYSVGTHGGRDQRLDKGELTARWLVSPGVPIVKVAVDENLTPERLQQKRVWAVALNALGEIFTLTQIPIRAAQSDGPAERLEEDQEIRAWKTGRTGSWQLCHLSQRAHRPFSTHSKELPTYYPHSLWVHNVEVEDAAGPTLKELQTWAVKSPLEMQSTFEGWDMQRRLEVDFAGDDEAGGGQHVVVVRCGSAEENDESAALVRYSTVGLRPNIASNHAADVSHASNGEASYEWRCSNLSFGRVKNYHITATAADCSSWAVTTSAEDVAIRDARKNEEQAAKQSAFSLDVDKQSPLRIPGQRARFITAGTSMGQIFVWNIRDTPPTSADIEREIQPSSFIQTDSSAISSLAMTSLYLVHGGSEGLVQAWDPLGSTSQPLRTISSALSGRSLRQAQADPTTQSRGLWAAGAIALDPEPTILRGIVALRGTLRYWSYSSSSPSKSTKTTKRRLHRASRGLNSSPGDGFTTGRRGDLKGIVQAELSNRGIDEAEKLAEARQHKKFAGRFGLDLLGEDASEEELLAYATMLSQEENEKKMQKAAEKKLHRDATEDEVLAHMQGLSQEDKERWQFASWEERFQMAADHDGNAPPDFYAGQEDDVARALRLSLRESNSEARAQSSSPPRHQGPSRSHFPSFTDADAVDDETAEAIRRSLADAGDEGTSTPTPPASSVPPTPSSAADDEDDVARAIRLSLQEQTPSPRTPGSRAAQRGNSFADEDFPSLSSSSSPSVASPQGRDGGGWGKGKKKAW